MHIYCLQLYNIGNSYTLPAFIAYCSSLGFGGSDRSAETVACIGAYCVASASFSRYMYSLSEPVLHGRVHGGGGGAARWGSAGGGLAAGCGMLLSTGWSQSQRGAPEGTTAPPPCH